MKLLDLKKGHSAVISLIGGGRGTVARMAELGLYTGRRIRMVQAAPFHGPLLVEDVESGAKIMIGRGIASRVEVEHETIP